MFWATSATRWVAIMARSTARVASVFGWGAVAAACGLGFSTTAGLTGLVILAPKNQTPAPNPTPSATQAQSRFTNKNVPMAAGKNNMRVVPQCAWRSDRTIAGNDAHGIRWRPGQCTIGAVQYLSKT